ncbi:hypothetical protein ACH5RR_023027 [Cinchona calisaya]|uniref:RING-type E3 ubiquitin transferase n=1 Tax=Cinchona calisaya TaxID=153742 RepID=A0ABD2Z9H0_9GENT
MGQFMSKRQQNHPHHQQHRLHPPTPPPPPPQPPQPPQPSPVSSSSLPSSCGFTGNGPFPTLPQPAPPAPAPPLPPPPYHPSSSTPYHNNYNYNYSNYSRPVNMMGSQPNYHNPYYAGHGNGWFRQPAMPLAPMPALQPMPPPPVPYVDHQSAKKIKNDVNVHKDTIKLEVDQGNKDCHLVSFTFDAMVEGSITIYYFAKEGTKCTFTPVYPEIYVPTKIPFQKGLGQKFCQPSGSGIDFGFFDIDDLSKPSAGDVFPIVISAESCLPSTLTDDQSNEEALNTSHAQITQAVIEKNNEDHFQVKVMKQILWIDGVRYELREIFGISDSDERAINDKDSGKECIICMTEPKDTTVLPCRHMCMCSECAKELRLQTNKCPICRQPIEELLEIKVEEAVS